MFPWAKRGTNVNKSFDVEGDDAHERVTVNTIKRELLLGKFRVLNVEKFLMILFDLTEALPADVECNVAATLSKEKEISTVLDLLMNAKKSPALPRHLENGQRDESARIHYPVAWVACVLIKDGNVLFRNAITKSPYLLQKYKQYYASLPDDGDAVVCAMVTRTLTVVFKHDPLLVTFELCRDDAHANANKAPFSTTLHPDHKKSSSKFAQDLVRHIHGYYIYRFLPNLVCVKDSDQGKPYRFHAPTRNGILHLHRCDVLQALSDQFAIAVRRLYGLSLSGQTQNSASAQKGSASDNQPLLAERRVANQNSESYDERIRREVDRLEHSVNAIRDVSIRVLLIPLKWAVASKRSDQSAEMDEALITLNAIDSPEVLMSALDLALVVARDAGCSAPLATVLECCCSIYELYGNPPGLSSKSSAALQTHSKSKFEDELTRRVPAMAPLLDDGAAGVNVSALYHPGFFEVRRSSNAPPALGRARLALIHLYSLLMRHGDMATLKTLVEQRVPRRILKLFAEHPQHSLFQEYIAKTLDIVFVQQQGGERCRLLASRFLSKDGLVDDLLDQVHKAQTDTKVDYFSDKPMYGYVLEIAMTLREVMSKPSAHAPNPVRDVMIAEGQDKKLEELVAALNVELGEVASGVIPAPRRAQLRLKQLEAVRALFEDDGDKVYYLRSIAEIRQKQVNPGFNLFEFLGLKDESSSSAAAPEEVSAASEPRRGHRRSSTMDEKSSGQMLGGLAAIEISSDKRDPRLYEHSAPLSPKKTPRSFSGIDRGAPSSRDETPRKTLERASSRKGSFLSFDFGGGSIQK